MAISMVGPFLSHVLNAAGRLLLRFYIEIRADREEEDEADLG